MTILSVLYCLTVLNTKLNLFFLFRPMTQIVTYAFNTKDGSAN